jgi:hypothetical protein
MQSDFRFTGIVDEIEDTKSETVKRVLLLSSEGAKRWATLFLTKKDGSPSKVAPMVEASKKYGVVREWTGVVTDAGTDKPGYILRFGFEPR